MFFIDQELGDDFEFALLLHSDDGAVPSDDVDDEIFGDEDQGVDEEEK